MGLLASGQPGYGGRRGCRRGGGGLSYLFLVLIAFTWFSSSPVSAGVKCNPCENKDDCQKKKNEEGPECALTCIQFTSFVDGAKVAERFCANGPKDKEGCDEGDTFEWINPDNTNIKKSWTMKGKLCYCKMDTCLSDGATKAPAGGGNGNGKKYPSSVMVFVASTITLTMFGVLSGRV